MEGVAVRKPRVWVAHDDATKNLSQAADFGTLTVLQRGPSPSVYSPQPIVEECYRILNDPTDGIQEGDYILLVGSPSICAIVAIVAADLLDGKVQLLQWDRQERRYLEVRFDAYAGN
jgi:hypothetical protein